MYILNCLTQEHQTRYIVAALLICLAGCVLTIGLLGRARDSSGVTRLNWIVLSGIVGGCMIWTTHFSAMVGFSTSVLHTYDPFIAAAALLFAIVGVTTASAVFAFEERGSLIEASGVLLGLSMMGVHAIGMLSYTVQARVEWHLPTLAASLALAVAFGVVATNRLGRPSDQWSRFASMAALAVGVLSMHFTSMAAMVSVPDPTVEISVPMMSDTVLMLAVLTIMTLLLVCGWAFYFIDAKTEREARDRYEHLENHDPLTGLINRARLGRYLEEMIEISAANGNPLAVVYFDIRRFRNVNNVHGYAAGDEILRLMARRLSKDFKDNAILARVGGDEFVAVVPGYGMQDMADFTCRMMKTISKPIIWRSKPVVLETNMGVSLFPADGRSADILLSRASLALGRARKDGILVGYHDENRYEAIRSKSELALDLRHAMDRGEFQLHYQRQNSAKTRELVGFEVLLRWNHPEKGMIPPSQFIPLAEAYGYISEIGEWVLRTACREAARWPAPYKIAVNVAPDQLSDHRLPEIVFDALSSSGLPASRLELEMTESGVVADPAYTLSIISRLKAVGVSLAMDDYGTGSSSLSTLQNFPFDKIKIDKSFVTSVETNPQSAAIIKSTVILGKSLKIPILAEGVETECALKYLRRLGCTEVQGFLFGKPVPSGRVCEIMA